MADVVRLARKRYRIVGKAKDGTRILQQPVTRKANITMAQARAIVRRYFREQLRRD